MENPNNKIDKFLELLKINASGTSPLFRVEPVEEKTFEEIVGLEEKNDK
ncbi:MAG: hypothetical protein IKD04_01945 [Clostridia bacterium]|nr:hypothetical protein [Clostridia bacterium]